MNQPRKLPDEDPWSVWDAERLRRKQLEEPRPFARGFQMRAFSDDERKFPSFGQCLTPGVNVADVARRGWPVFVGVDLSGPRRPGNAIAVVAVDPSSQRRFPLEMLSGNWTSPQVAQQIQAVNSRHPNVRIIVVENNGYQQALIDWIKSSPGDHSYWFKIQSFTTGANKASPDVGLPSLEVEFRNKSWVFPQDETARHDNYCVCGWCTLYRELRDYPMAATSDAVMALWFAREGMSRWQGLTAGQSQGGRGGSSGDFNSR